MLLRHLGEQESEVHRVSTPGLIERDILIDPLTLQGLRESLGQEGLESLVALYAQQAEARVAVLKGALGEEGDAEQARHAAHQLKGESSSLGAIKVAALAGRLECLTLAGDRQAAQEIGRASWRERG